MNIKHRTLNAEQRTENGRTLLVCVVLAMAVLTAYEPIRHNGFVNLDDNVYVAENANIKNGLSSQSLAWSFTSREAANWHPLTWISHILDCQLFGLNPVGHHFTSLLLHIINTVLLFFVLWKMTGSLRHTNGGQVWPSAFVAALFALHPLHVESVAWVSERKDVLSTLFWLLTMLAYIHYTRRPSVSRYASVFIFLALGLMAKPMLVTLPFVLLLLDYWPLKRPVKLNLLFEKVPLFILSAIFSVITFAVQKASGAVLEGGILPVVARISNALVSYISYIGKIFYPVNLAVLYPLNLDGPPRWMAITCFLLLAIVSTAALLLRRRFGYLFTGWFWFLGTLVPVIGLVQVGSQSMTDRYIYIPGIGIYIIVAWLAGDLASRLKLPKGVLWAGSAVVLGVLLMMTRAQVRYWKDSISLCRRAIAVTKYNYIMHTLLGDALEEEGFNDEASAQFKKALQIKPNYSRALNSYGLILAQEGLYDEAIGHFNKALSGQPYIPGVLNNLCKAGFECGKLDEVLEIIKGLEQKQADNAELYYNEGMIYGMQGNDKKCIELIEKALELAGRQNKRELVSALQIMPNYARALNSYGIILAQEGFYDEAIGHFNKALAADPYIPGVFNNLCKAGFECGKLDEVLRIIKDLEQKQADNAELYYNEGMIYRMQGNDKKCIELLEKALELASQQNKHELVAEIKPRLERYRQTKQGN